MGKSWKNRSHLNTGYPYDPIRVAHLQVLRPQLARHQEEKALFMGLFADAPHPVFGKGELLHRSSDLKRLEFLRAFGQYYYTKVANVYSTSRAFVPTTLHPGLKAVENRVSAVGTPLMHTSEQVLWTLDRKVDSLCLAASKVWQAESPYEQEQRMQARDSYLSKVDETLEFLRQNGISGAAKHAMGMRDANTAIVPAEQDSSIVSKLAMLPPVEYTQKKYADAHEAVVTSQIYNKTLEVMSELMHRFQESSVYRSAASRLYPVISPLADPALDKLLASPLYSAVVDHLKPVTPPQGLSDKTILQVVSCAQC